jgi:hypothetical protein
MNTRLRAIIAALALILCSSAGADFSFALLGDAPYGAGEETLFVEMLRDIDREDVAFVVHVGDFKNGWTSCSDMVFEQRRALFDTSRHAFIYIAGDNEWTDCHRMFAGGYDPLERLAALRVRFFGGTSSLGRVPLRLVRQSDNPAAPQFPEHMRWQHGGVLFVALNFPGGDNNARMPEESAARTAAALTWMEQSFALARQQGARGIAVLMQANPFLRSNNPRRGYQTLLAALAKETSAFDGAVLLSHGDTHTYRIDQPLKHPQNGKVLTNFTRTEVFGSPDVSWLRVRVVENGGGVQFAISPGR